MTAVFVSKSRILWILSLIWLMYWLKSGFTFSLVCVSHSEFFSFFISLNLMGNSFAPKQLFQMSFLPPTRNTHAHTHTFAQDITCKFGVNSVSMLITLMQILCLFWVWAYTLRCHRQQYLRSSRAGPTSIRFQQEFENTLPGVLWQFKLTLLHTPPPFSCEKAPLSGVTLQVIASLFTLFPPYPPTGNNKSRIIGSDYCLGSYFYCL